MTPVLPLLPCKRERRGQRNDDDVLISPSGVMDSSFSRFIRPDGFNRFFIEKKKRSKAEEQDTWECHGEM